MENKMEKGMNGYEIRTEVLKMAKEFLEVKYYSDKDTWYQGAEKDDKDRILDVSTAPKMPTLEDILSTANTMYAFVQSK